MQRQKEIAAMKRLLPALAALTFLATTPALADDPPASAAQAEESRDDNDRRDSGRYDRSSVIDDVIRMSQAGVNDEAIIRFLRESRDAYVLDADVIIQLTEAKVSKDVLNAVMDHAYRRGQEGRARRDDRRSTTVYVRPYYDPWFYSYGWGPYWYGPRISYGWGWGGYRHFRHPRRRH
jgi:hypothetical protein